MYSHGADANEAHFFCYESASSRVTPTQTATGLATAVGAAAGIETSQMFSTMGFP
jgi:hypothetical protein